MNLSLCIFPAGVSEYNTESQPAARSLRSSGGQQSIMFMLCMTSQDRSGVKEPKGHDTSEWLGSKPAVGGLAGVMRLRFGFTTQPVFDVFSAL